MNTIHRVGLTIAGVVALLVVGGAFVVQGYTGAQADAAQAAAAQAAAAQQTASPTATTDASLDPVTVYVEPMPTQPAVPKANPALQDSLQTLLLDVSATIWQVPVHLKQYAQHVKIRFPNHESKGKS